MAVDHSLTYKVKSLQNLPHRARLNKIKRLVERNCVTGGSYCDFGCSNGYITNILKNAIGTQRCLGRDHSENIEAARERYDDITFEFIDLNVDNEFPDKFKNVTCFETLEHVGNLRAAIGNLLRSRTDDGILIISVPIEIGFWGIIKYFAKRFLYRYKFELTQSELEYVKALFLGRNISGFREPSDGYGTHFGFDYREVDNLLNEFVGAGQVRAFNSFTTRFYLAGKSL